MHQKNVYFLLLDIRSEEIMDALIDQKDFIQKKLLKGKIYLLLLAWVKNPRIKNFIQNEHNIIFQDILWYEFKEIDMQIEALYLFLKNNMNHLKYRIANELFSHENELLMQMNMDDPTYLNPDIRQDSINLLSFFWGESNVILKFRKKIIKISRSSGHILLLGKEGLEQKEIAHYIHSISDRSKEKFQVIDAQKLPESLHKIRFSDKNLRELPGYNKIYYNSKKSLKGTLLLHNIHTLSWEMQGHLLNLLEEDQKKIFSEDWSILGSQKIILSADSQLEKMVTQGIFRQDLFSRINSSYLRIPELKERGFDLIYIVDQFCKWYRKKYQKSFYVSPFLKIQLLKCKWERNVSQLYDFLSKMATLSNSIIDDMEALKILRPDIDFSIKVSEPDHVVQDSFGSGYNEQNDAFLRENENHLQPTLFSKNTLQGKFHPGLANVEISYIQLILKAHKGNMAEAARVLGISRKTLYNKVKTYKIKIGRIA